MNGLVLGLDIGIASVGVGILEKKFWKDYSCEFTNFSCCNC